MFRTCFLSLDILARLWVEGVYACVHKRERERAAKCVLGAIVLYTRRKGGFLRGRPLRLSNRDGVERWQIRLDIRIYFLLHLAEYRTACFFGGAVTMKNWKPIVKSDLIQVTSVCFRLQDVYVQRIITLCRRDHQTINGPLSLICLV